MLNLLEDLLYIVFLGLLGESSQRYQVKKYILPTNEKKRTELLWTTMKE